MKSRETRKLQVIVGSCVVVALAATTASCSSDRENSNSGADNSGSSSAPNASASQDAYPVTIPTKFGEVTISEEPQRVVALGWGDAEAALEFGVRPVGASDWVAFGGNGVGPWVEDGSSSDSEDSTANDVGVNYDTPPEIIGTMEPEFEKIAALKPDLILDVRSSGDSARYEKLSAIAPTVGVPEGADNYLTPREDQVSMIATALGQKSRGEEVNREYSDRLAAIRADHPQWASMTVAAVSATASGWGAYVKGSNRVDTLLDLGFQQNSVLAAEKTGETGFSVKLSDETLSKADSDLVVGFAVGLSPEEMADRGPWKDLAATKERRSFVMPKELSSAFSLGSPQSTRFALDKLVPLLEEHTRAK